MSKYVEFPLEGGGSILIETSDEPEKGGAGFVRGGQEGQQAGQARQSLDASLEGVRRSADLLVHKLRSLGEPPDEMEIMFSLKASGELGNLAVGRAGSDANYAVTLRWRKEESKDKEREPARKRGGRKGTPTAAIGKRLEVEEEAPEPDDDDDGDDDDA